MSVSPAEARDALRAVAQTSLRSAQSTGYRNAAPFLMVWGVIWMLGYGAPALSPSLPNTWVWLVLDAIGFGATMLLTYRLSRVAKTPTGAIMPCDAARVRKVLAMIVINVVFIVATFVVMRPTEPAQFQVFPVLVLGLVYGLFGVLQLPNLAWVGAVPAMAGLLAFFYLQAYLPLVIAVFGGGALLVGGLLMRRL
jgi:hypothetical protein